MTLAELKAAIRKEMNAARARQMDAQDRGDDDAEQKNQVYARRCEIALEVIAEIESES